MGDKIASRLAQAQLGQRWLVRRAELREKVALRKSNSRGLIVGFDEADGYPGLGRGAVRGKGTNE